MSLVLYYFPPSPPSRAVLCLIKYMGLEVEIKMVNIAAGEQHKPEFLKLNPQHAIPVLTDNGLVLTESKAILSYLANKYRKVDSLYPKLPADRAIVDQKLHFDANYIAGRAGACWVPVLFGGEKAISEKSKANLYEGMKYLDDFLSQTKWIAGDNLTIADFPSLVLTNLLDNLKGVFDISSYSNIQRWLEEGRKLPGFEEVNTPGVEMFRSFLYSKLEPE